MDLLAQARRLSFPREVEDAFQEDYYRNTIRIAQTTMAIGIGIMAIFGILDRLALPMTYKTAWLIRGAVCIPIMIIAEILSFSPRFWRLTQIAFTLAIMTAGLGIDVMIAMSVPGEVGYVSYYVGVMLVVFGGYFFLQVQFRPALFSGLVLIGGYLLVAIFIQDLPRAASMMPVFVSNTFFSIATLFIGGVGAYLIEYYRRRDFVQRYAMAQQNADLDAYARTVAHDLKNPVALVIGTVEIIEEDFAADLTSDVRRELAVIAETSRSMVRIINDLLMLARVRKQEEIQLSPLEMQAVVSSALARLELDIKNTQAQIKQPKAWPSALGHPAWVEEVWSNYISNAIKYGGVPPVVELGADAQGAMVRFWVRDNGPGLDQSEREQIFAEFSRLGSAGKKEGHGLGLSIVQRIVQKLGGDVGVESQGGNGSMFYFDLPIADSHTSGQPVALDSAWG